MSDLSEQVFEQATMLQKRYMDGFKAGQNSIINTELLEVLKCIKRKLSHLPKRVKESYLIIRDIELDTEQAITKAEGR